jgi:hypothetical protein
MLDGFIICSDTCESRFAFNEYGYWMVACLCMNIYCVILSGADFVPRLLRCRVKSGGKILHRNRNKIYWHKSVNMNVMTSLPCFKASVIKGTGKF